MMIRSMKNTTLLSGATIVAVGAMVLFFFFPIKKFFAIGDSPVELYYADHISNAHQEVIDRFNEEYKDQIKVVPVDLPFSKFSTNELKEMLARSLRSKSERLDVFSVDVIWVPRFAKWAYALDKHFNQESLNALNRTALESCYYDEKLVTMPIYIDVGILYYRRDLLRRFKDYEDIEKNLEQCITWDDFISLGKRWQQYNLPYFVFPADNFEGFICLFLETISEQQNKLIFEGDSINLDQPDVKRGLKLLHDMIHKWQFTPQVVTDFNENQCLNYALDNDALFVRGWPGYRFNFDGPPANYEKLQQLVEIPVPHFPGEEKSGVYGGWNLMISKFSKKKKEALEFISFIQQERQQMIFFEKSGYFPVLNSIYQNSEFIRQNPEITYCNELLKTGRHRPFREKKE